MEEFISILLRFALICLSLSCFVAWRSHANYSVWLTRRQLTYLSASRTMLELSETALSVGRWALFFAVVSFLLFINQ